MSTVLWVGYGDIGQRTSPLLVASGYSVIGARRSPVFDQCTAELNFSKGDARQQAAWQKWLQHKPESIVLSMVPTEFTEEGYLQGYFEPIQALLTVLREIPSYQPSIYFISSTSVFGDADGHWVDESTQPNPAGFSGRIMLACEKSLLTSGYSGFIVRCSGIYGPGRTRLIDSVRTQQVKLHTEWTNRIYVTDIARAICFLMRQKSSQMDVIHLTDNAPTPQSEVVTWLAKNLGVCPDNLQWAETPPTRGSKRISNRKIKTLGFQFQYSSYKEGYQSLIT